MNSLIELGRFSEAHEVLDFISKLFGVEMKDDSLLRKEYELFSNLGKEETKEETEQAPIEVADGKTEPQPIVQQNEEKQTEVVISAPITKGKRRKLDFSSLSNTKTSSVASVTNNMSGEEQIWFENCKNNGLISLICK